MLGIQFIQKLVAQVDQTVLLSQLVTLLFMVKRRLPDQQNDQEKETQDQEKGSD